MNLQAFKKAAITISDDPMSRVPEYLKPHIASEALINCHCHIFNQTAIPKRLYNIKMPYSKRLASHIATRLHRIVSRSNDDWFSRQAYFIELIKASTIEITDKLLSYFPSNSILCPLMMDMQAGRVGKKQHLPADHYIQAQATDIKKLIDLKYPLLPFLPLDPNNEAMFQIFMDGFTGKYGFMPFGIKIYPTLGYLPGHPLLMEIYRVCEEKNIPVTTHCSRGIVHGYRKRLRNIPGWKIGPNGQLTNQAESRWFINGSAYAKYFNHPKNWEMVLRTYPRLRLNFGHFGGAKQWFRLQKGKNNSWCSRIMDYFNRFENVYADLSFTNAYPELFELIQNRMQNSQLMRERCLYGFDYYMVVVKGHYRSLKVDFDMAMGDQLIRQMAIVNSRKFLFNKS